MRQQLDDALAARRSAEERAEKLGIEVARLTEQLRQEHDAVAAAEGTRKKLETSLRELTVRLEEYESVSDGKKNLMRMQQRVSHLPLTQCKNHRHFSWLQNLKVGEGAKLIMDWGLVWNMCSLADSDR